MKRGYIYILQSLERPDIVKIGKTTVFPKKRCQEHNRNWYLSINTWDVKCWRWVEDCTKAEFEIHKLLVRHNIQAKRHREAFRISVDVARETMTRVCDMYPAKSNKRTKVISNKKDLDQVVYAYITRNHGLGLTEIIVKNKKLMSEVDFYKWLLEIRHYLFG